MNMDIGPLDAIADDASIQNWSWNGPSAVGLTDILRRVGCTWFESDGLDNPRAVNQIRFNRPGQIQSDAPEVTVGQEVINVPVVTDEGAQAKMLLTPLATIGGPIKIETPTHTGRWKIVSLRHEGDNWISSPGDGFYTKVELRPIAE